MKKQTAVEWLVEQLENANVISSYAFLEVIQQAKATEKEQIVTAYKEGYDHGYDHGLYEDEPEDSFDFYYTETYKLEQDGNTNSN